MPTKSQQLLLDFIEAFTDENNYSPSYREIAAALGLSSVASVAQHIDNCVEAGYLIKVPHAARSLRVIRGEGFDESRRLFQSHIDAIKDRIKIAEEAGETEKVGALEDDLMTLRAAAKILKLEI
jgi:SOS-response transcriptional repressor LexA